MLVQIIVNTPLWVWGLLGFLIYRGIRSMADREIRFSRIFIVPLVMLGLSLHDIASTFGAGLTAMLTWLASAIVAGVLAWRFSARRAVAYPERSVMFQPGSWVPLSLMMGIFFTKYGVAVTLALQPHYGRQAGLVLAISALYGVFNGIFLGNLLRIISIYRHASNALATVFSESFTDWGSQKF